MFRRRKGLVMPLNKWVSMSVLGFCAAGFVFAQDRPVPSRPLSLEQPIQLAQKEKAEKPEKMDAKKPSARMPNYFPKLGLSEQQREKILNTLADYNDQIDELEDQIRELKDKRDSEIRVLLTAAQKEKLAELELDARKKRSEKNKKSEPANPEKSGDK